MSAVREIRPLTGLRGLAAVYVVIHHYFMGVPFTNPLNNFIAHGYLAVDLFFILSGFVMALNYAELFRDGGSWKAFRTFLGRRIARVYPLYFAGTVCGAILVLAGCLEWQSGPRLSLALPINLAMIQAWDLGPSLDGPAWSISAEWAAYLLFPLALALIYRGSVLKAKIVSGVSALLIVALCELPSTLVRRGRPLALIDLHDSFHAGPLLRCLPEFLLGIAIARWWLQEGKAPIYRTHLVAEGVCFSVLALATVVKTDALIVLLFPLLILTLTSADHWPGRFLASSPIHHLGLLSYSIYLVHDLLGGLIGWVHTYANLHGLAHGETFGAVIAMILTYPISLAAYHGVEKPGRDLLRSRFEGVRKQRLARM